MIYILSSLLFILGFILGFLWKQKAFLKVEREKISLEVEKKVLIENQSDKFENMAQKILDNSSTKLQKESEKNLSALLSPFKERLKDFQFEIRQTHEKEARQYFDLKKEIDMFTKANEKMTSETQHLTQALKGDIQTQGLWGELKLERLLSISGLRKEEEYTLQGKDMGLKDEEGRHQKPDAIVNLPEGKHIIIDSKVSLTHYEKILSAEGEEKETYKKLFLRSLENHVKDLSSKKYHHSEKLNTPDFVLMFVPVEGAFAAALETDRKLFTEAWEKNIIMVSPTTLLTTLRTVASVWKLSRQNENTKEMVKACGLLYDKFVGFVDSLENVGEHVQKAQGAWGKAMNQLKEGKGNLISRAETIKVMGAKTSKSLPDHLTNPLEKVNPKEL